MDVRVPNLGESIVEATVAQWYKQPGDAVALDEPICELETDKVTVEVPASAAGSLEEVMVGVGSTVEVGAVLARIAEGKTGKTNKGKARAPDIKDLASDAVAARPSKPAPPAPPPAAMPPSAPPEAGKQADKPLSPAVRHLLAEHKLDPQSITGTGKHGRLTKADILAVVSGFNSARPAPAPKLPPPVGGYGEERVKMSRLRQTIAVRLKQAQNTAAILTTFNEVDMQPIMALRAQYKDSFEAKYGIRLGLMGFFVRACVVALQEIPNINARIDGEDIIFNHAVHMGVAVSTDKGLVVPVLRDAQTRSLAAIEQGIADLGARARDGKLELQDLQGGTFSISNGGVFGSLLSTPILNVPQSGILGMHKIQERAVVIDGQLAVRPMMYLALSYDHRLVDGKDAVTFLVRVRTLLESPERSLLEV